MAITGHFEADFSQFNGAIIEATRTLDTLKQDSTETGKALDAMGAKAPGDVKALTGATTAASKEVSGLGSITRQVGGMIAGAFTVQELYAFTAQSMAAAAAIGTVATKTGMTTAEVQKLQFVAGQTSVDFGALTSAAQGLQADLGNDNAGVVGALKKLNINVAEFKALSPYEQFARVSDAIRGLPSPTDQATAAFNIFHNKWKEIFPAIKDDIVAIGDAAPIIADAFIENADRMEKRWNEMKANFGTWVANISGVIEGQKDKAAADAKTMVAVVESSGQSIEESVAGAMNAIPHIVNFGIQGFQDFTLSLDDAKKAEKELADQFEKDNPRFKESIAAIGKYWEDVAKVTERLLGKDAISAAKQLTDVVLGLGGSVSAFAKSDLEGMNKTLADAIDALNRTGGAGGQLQSEFIDLQATVQGALTVFQDVGPDLDGSMRAAEQAVADARAEEAKYTQALYDAAVAEDAAAIATQRGKDELARKRNEIEKTTTALYSMNSAYSTGDLNEQAARTGGQIALDSYGNKYVWIPGKNAAPPGRATGGPVNAGASYMVGERGPELFVPGSSGSIVPGGGVTVSNVFHIVDTEANIARRVSDTILRSITSARRV